MQIDEWLRPSTVIAIYSAAVIGIARYPTSSLSIAGHAFHIGFAIAAFGVLSS